MSMVSDEGTVSQFSTRMSKRPFLLSTISEHMTCFVIPTA